MAVFTQCEEVALLWERSLTWEKRCPRQALVTYSV